MRFLRQTMIGLFLASVALGLLVYAASLVGGAVQDRMAQEPFSPPARERVFAVNVVTATPEDIVPTLETYGEVQSRRLLELRAAVGGRVTELSEAFQDGGAVMQGQVLVQLDPADARDAVARAENDVADAAAEERDATRGLALARDTLTAAVEQSDLRARAFDRQVDLAARGVGTAASTETAELAAAAARQAVLSSRQAVAQAEVRVDLAKTRRARSSIALAEAQRRLADTTITAPFDGTLTATDVVVGRLVSGNERLAELLDPDDLEVSFRVSTAQYARLLDAEGRLLTAPVRAVLDVAGLDLEARGQITRASAGAGDGATGRLIFATLSEARGFKPGDFVTVRVEEPALTQVVRLPATALDAREEVLALDTEDRLEAIPVTLLRRQGDTVLVRGPIEGRAVVRERSPLLGAGIAVTPLRPDGAQAAQAEPEMLELTEDRRARLVAFIEGNTRMPEEAKARVLSRLQEPQVPARMVARIESRMGG